MLDSLADETMTTGDKNDVRHVVRVWAGGRGGRDEWRVGRGKEGREKGRRGFRLFIYRGACATFNLAFGRLYWQII
jgi:hypothetical protein